MSSDAFPLTEAQIIGLTLECIFYGIYLITLAYCLKVLLCLPSTNLALKRKRDVKRSMLAVALLMFVFTTLDVAFGLLHNLQAFIFYKGPGGAAEQFNKLTDWVTIMKSVDYFALTSIGDGMLIYRFYVVYESRINLVLVPMLIWVACIVTEAGATWKESSIKSDATLNDPRIQVWMYATYAMTLALNTSLTSLIVWKLWNVHSRVTHLAVIRADRLLHVVRIIVDSALVYTLSVFVLVGCNIARSNALYPVSDIIAQLIGITFNLIITRSQDVAQTAENPAYLMRESYRLPHIDSAANYSTTITIPQVYKEYGKDHERPDEQSGKGALKSGHSSQITQVFPVEDV